MVDLLVAMCRAALESPRKSIIFEPYPSVVDPNDPKTLAFNPKVSAGGQCFPMPGVDGAGGSPEDPSDGRPSPAPRVEEELRAAAEGPGQRDVHPGDDPGTLAWPRHHPWPRVRPPAPVRDPSLGVVFWCRSPSTHSWVGAGGPACTPSLFCQGSYLEIKKQMDKLDPLAHPLLQW